jgi:hypothetical protein
LLALFAGFIILRLRNILGRRTGHQGKPMGKYFPRGMETLEDIEKNESIMSNNVDEKAKKQFLKGADIAYEQIITYFATGDKKSLKNLLGKNLFTDFSGVIDERKKKETKHKNKNNKETIRRSKNKQNQKPKPKSKNKNKKQNDKPKQNKTKQTQKLNKNKTKQIKHFVFE